MAKRIAVNADTSATTSRTSVSKMNRKKAFIARCNYSQNSSGPVQTCAFGNVVVISQTSVNPHPLVILYCGNAARDRPYRAAATLLGLQHVPAVAGKDCAQPTRRPRYLRGHAYRRRQVAVLPTTHANLGQDCNRNLATDRADAGPGSPTRANGH